MEEILEVGGYFAAVSQGFFVDSGQYPERNGDGIARDPQSGVGVDTVVPRDADYFAPVCAHFGYNNVPSQWEGQPCQALGGCTLCQPEKIAYVDELDATDNVAQRLQQVQAAEQTVSQPLVPEVEWAGDGWINIQVFFPTDVRAAEAAALAMADRLGLTDNEVIHKQVLHPAEGTYLEVKGRVPFVIDVDELVIPEEVPLLSAEAIRQAIAEQPLKVVAATVGQDEHSVGMREIIDIKHGGLEGFGIECFYLGTSVPVQKVIDAAIEIDADAILISTIITHADIHRINMQRLHDLCVEKGVRDKFLLVGGGTQVTNEIAVKCGLDAGFGRGTRGIHVANFLVRQRQARQSAEA